jgi:hypothetical protein
MARKPGDAVSLNNPDSRRAWRTVVATVVVLFLLVLAWRITDRLADAPSLREVARWGLGIVALFMLGYVMENGLRSFKWNLPGGFGGEADNGDQPVSQAAQAVADSAQSTADDIKGTAQ